MTRPRVRRFFRPIPEGGAIRSRVTIERGRLISFTVQLEFWIDGAWRPAERYERFLNEISWKRTNARSTEEPWPRIPDVLLPYSKTDTYTFRSLTVAADKAKLPHTLTPGPDGLKFQTYESTAPGLDFQSLYGARVQRVLDNFAYNAGSWRVEQHPRFLADLTGDGRVDVIGVQIHR